MKKAVLINQSTGYLMIDIVNAYADQYKKVVLITGNIEKIERDIDKKVKVVHIISYNRTSAMKRTITWLWGTVQIFFKLLFNYWDYEIIYVTNPPMSYLLSIVFRRPFSIIIYDIYPDALKNIGVSEKNFLSRVWAALNKILFKRAKKIITLSDGMANMISTNYNCDKKVIVIPNWSASELFIPRLKKENFFVSRHNLEDKFVVMYSGNIGYTHNIEIIIEVAKILKDHKEICFYFIGEGKKKELLISRVKEYGLTSCYFLTWQSKEILPYSLASADLALITLNEETAILSVPSKTYNLLAVGVPLMCIATKESELNSLVLKYKNGRCFNKDDVNEMAMYIMELQMNKELKSVLSENSLKASTNFSYINALKYV